MARPRRDELFDALLDFGRVVGSSIASAASSVVLRLSGDGPMEGDEDEDDDDEAEVVDAEVWGSAAVLHRPEDPDNDGACEGVFVRHGDERVVIATKDRRWQIEIEKGEVVLRNTVAAGGDTKQAHIRIKRNGEIVIDAEKVYVGVDGAGHTIGWGDAIKSHFDALKTTFDSHTHGYLGDSGTPALSTPPSSTPPPTPTPITFDATPSIESTHKVE